MRERLIVLLVEDEEDSRETLKELLEIEGYDVRTAADGKLALEQIDLLGEQQFVMLLDLFMPVMTGLEVIEALRDSGRLATTRIVITSSAKHRAPAGLPFCGKPLDFEVLLRTIEAASASATRIEG